VVRAVDRARAAGPRLLRRGRGARLLQALADLAADPPALVERRDRRLADRTPGHGRAAARAAQHVAQRGAAHQDHSGQEPGHHQDGGAHAADRVGRGHVLELAGQTAPGLHHVRVEPRGVRLAAEPEGAGREPQQQRRRRDRRAEAEGPRAQQAVVEDQGQAREHEGHRGQRDGAPHDQPDQALEPTADRADPEAEEQAHPQERAQRDEADPGQLARLGAGGPGLRALGRATPAGDLGCHRVFVGRRPVGSCPRGSRLAAPW
jgi:hypothetical protein